MPWYMEKVGPVPAWVLVVGGGVGLGVLALRVRSSARSAPTPAPLDVSTSEDAPYLPGLGPMSGGSVPLYNNAITGNGSLTNIKTNNDWNNYALSVLIGMGYDPTIAAGALSKFLDGTTLTAQENAMVQVALSKIGPAPTPPPPPRTSSPVKANPLPSPVPTDPLNTPGLKGPGQGYSLGNRGTYVTRAGDNLQRVAEFIYGFGPTQVGAADQFRWRQIYDANTAGSLAGFPADGSYPLPPGLTLWLPL